MLSRKQDSRCQNWGFSVNQQGATFVHIFLTPNMRRASLTDVYLTSGRYICFFWVFFLFFFYVFFSPLKHTAEQNSFAVYLLAPSIPAFLPYLFKTSTWWLHCYCAQIWGNLGTIANLLWEPCKIGKQLILTINVWYQSKRIKKKDHHISKVANSFPVQF